MEENTSDDGLGTLQSYLGVSTKTESFTIKFVSCHIPQRYTGCVRTVTPRLCEDVQGHADQ